MVINRTYLYTYIAWSRAWGYVIHHTLRDVYNSALTAGYRAQICRLIAFSVRADFFV
jgi:hypothetical protein